MTAPSCVPDHPHSCLSRRAALAAGGAVAGVALAACGDGSEAPTTGDPAAAPTTLANVSDIPVGGAIAASSASAGDVLLTQPVEGQFHAFSAVCTHAGCACHGSVFDLATGAVLGGPAQDPLPEVSIEVTADGSVVG
jgi:nitrite reductase/ring-hydroxylating ferredoxin subunit